MGVSRLVFFSDICTGFICYFFLYRRSVVMVGWIFSRCETCVRCVEGIIVRVVDRVVFLRSGELEVGVFFGMEG